MLNIGKMMMSGRKTGFAAVLAASIGIGGPVTLGFEGMELKPYYDSVGVKTVCVGETESVEDREYSEEECVDRFNIQYGYYSFATARFYNEKATAVVTPGIHAAFTDMSYNVGISTVGKSSMIRYINEGNVEKACNSILLYKYAGGRDCTVRENNCYGVWKRRKQIHKLCTGDQDVI